MFIILYNIIYVLYLFVFISFSTNNAGCLEAGHVVAGLLKVLEDHSVILTLPPLSTNDIEKV